MVVAKHALLCKEDWCDIDDDNDWEPAKVEMTAFFAMQLFVVAVDDLGALNQFGLLNCTDCYEMVGVGKNMVAMLWYHCSCYY
mmetsp:Transcript_15610/g.29449  ORF Transcript_15610/g.29449 Transcript_15610/m.29449 type:complete len:83 (+) Transcript_15610:421-669(+)